MPTQYCHGDRWDVVVLVRIIEIELLSVSGLDEQEQDINPFVGTTSTTIPTPSASQPRTQAVAISTTSIRN